MTAAHALAAAEVFDGTRLHRGAAVVIEAGRVVAVRPRAGLPEAVPLVDLGEGVLAPGFVDLQVNGGGGVMFNDGPTAAAIATIAAAHQRLGTTALLPTLITDTPGATRAAIEAATAARGTVPGAIGLHLEGPHLAPARRGAHVAALMRPMADADADLLLEARERVGRLLVTVAAEAVEPRLVRRLADGGVVVSLGHSDAGYDAAMRAFDAGARMATHLFNAMSPLGHRAPGLAGAALDHGGVHAGIIADGHHVHPAALGVAVRGKRGPGAVFLVTDAMSTVGAAGVAGEGFVLNGRAVRREGDRLTLDDGTLAGSTVDMATSLGVLTGRAGLSREEALAMATRLPAEALGLDDGRGSLAPGAPADLVHLGPGLDVRATFLAGRPA